MSLEAIKKKEQNTKEKRYSPPANPGKPASEPRVAEPGALPTTTYTRTTRRGERGGASGDGGVMRGDWRTGAGRRRRAVRHQAYDAAGA